MHDLNTCMAASIQRFARSPSDRHGRAQPCKACRRWTWLPVQVVNQNCWECGRPGQGQAMPPQAAAQAQAAAHSLVPQVAGLLEVSKIDAGSKACSHGPGSWQRAACGVRVWPHLRPREALKAQADALTLAPCTITWPAQVQVWQQDRDTTQNIDQSSVHQLTVHLEPRACDE